MARGNGHLEWESSKNEEYAEKWWTDHGFTWKLKERFISYSLYAISKDEVTICYEIPNDSNIDIKKHMNGALGFFDYFNHVVDILNLYKYAQERREAQR